MRNPRVEEVRTTAACCRLMTVDDVTLENSDAVDITLLKQLTGGGTIEVEEVPCTSRATVNGAPE